MSTEDALIERVALDLCNAEVCMCDPIDGMNSSCISKLRTVATALGVSKEVLCWIAANPDTAAALAAGTMVGVPKLSELSLRARTTDAETFRDFAHRALRGDMQILALSLVKELELRWAAEAVSPPASDDGLGGKP